MSDCYLLSSPMSNNHIREIIKLWNYKRQFKYVTVLIIDNIANVYKDNVPEHIFRYAV